MLFGSIRRRLFEFRMADIFMPGSLMFSTGGESSRAFSISSSTQTWISARLKLAFSSLRIFHPGGLEIYCVSLSVLARCWLRAVGWIWSPVSLLEKACSRGWLRARCYWRAPCCSLEWYCLRGWYCYYLLFPALIMTCTSFSARCCPYRHRPWALAIPIRMNLPCLHLHCRL